jgi:anti-sigma B factor antagonist
MVEHVDPGFVVMPVAPPEGQQSLILKLVGNLAGENAHLLRRAVEPVFVSPTPPSVRLIMNDVHYIDSTGVGVIVSIIQQMQRHGGKLEIIGLSDVGRQLLSILRLTTLSDYVTVAGQSG